MADQARRHCQCCAQKKDARRLKDKQRCCAVGDCCESLTGKRMVQAARDALRAALTHAVAEEQISKNVASLVKVPTPRKRKVGAWSVDEAAIRLHDTRHTCGSLLAALGVHPRVAMKILRHSQISITMEIYTHVTDGQTREALRTLGDALG